MRILKTFQIVSRLALVVGVSFLGVPKVQAQSATVVGMLEAPLGDGANVVIEGNLAVVSNEQIGLTGGGFFIFDISTPTAPALVSQTLLAEKPTKGIATDIAVRGNLAFMPVFKADNTPPLNIKEDGLAIFDISDPAQPTLRSTVRFHTTVISDVAVTQTGIFYSSNPAREELSIGEFEASGEASLAVTLDIPGGASCVAVTSDGLGVVVGDIGQAPQRSSLSIVDPKKEKIIGSVDFTNDLIAVGILDFDPFGVVVSADDNFAFISGGFISDNIVVIDISDTDEPKFVTALDLSGDPNTGGSPFGISLTGDLLFAANALSNFPDSLLNIVDVSNPEAPFSATSVNPLGILVDVATRADNGGTITAVTVNADFQFPPFNLPGGITVIEVTP